MAGLIVVLMAGGLPQKKEILQLQADMINLTKTINQLQMTVDQTMRHERAGRENGPIPSQPHRQFAKVNQAVDGVKSQNDRETVTFERLSRLSRLSHHMTELQEGLSSSARRSVPFHGK